MQLWKQQLKSPLSKNRGKEEVRPKSTKGVDETFPWEGEWAIGGPGSGDTAVRRTVMTEDTFRGPC